MTEFVDEIENEESFASNLLIRSAVERQLEILGETLKKFRIAEPELAESIPKIHRIVAMRNVIAHEYGEIDYGIVWAALAAEVPEVLLRVEHMLRDEEC
ncbi:HepT-like ribonuclease domain-containing protein [Brevibacterium linens]|uniref:HepT-like ribonuclease domain-containing protein n=1 Tax=Brevibacterium linens TaxID=1703 RepID=UPI003F8A075A